MTQEQWNVLFTALSVSTWLAGGAIALCAVLAFMSGGRI